MGAGDLGDGELPGCVVGCDGVVIVSQGTSYGVCQAVAASDPADGVGAAAVESGDVGNGEVKPIQILIEDEIVVEATGRSH